MIDVSHCARPSASITVIPGHEIVGVVEEAGSSAENLCPHSMYTGWDADGGCAEYICASAEFTVPLPFDYSDVELAPLLCAGRTGFRALNRASLPEDQKYM